MLIKRQVITSSGIIVGLNGKLYPILQQVPSATVGAGGNFTLIPATAGKNICLISAVIAINATLDMYLRDSGSGQPITEQVAGVVNVVNRWTWSDPVTGYVAICTPGSILQIHVSGACSYWAKLSYSLID